MYHIDMHIVLLKYVLMATTTLRFRFWQEFIFETHFISLQLETFFYESQSKVVKSLNLWGLLTNVQFLQSKINVFKKLSKRTIEDY